LLGIGEDGHTASLFPGTDALVEYNQPVTAVFVPKFNTWRVTMTLPVLNAAREIVFLASGSSKSNIAQRILSVEQPTKDLPATLVNPENGMVHWMLDSDAAALINKNAKA
jgi:6-phosphogluconolactonase